jgi:hypothetical protein
VTTDLSDVRRLVLGQQARAAEVERRRVAALADLQAHPGLTVRCEKKHSGGKAPKMAEAHALPAGIFFISRIPWAPSDASTLRPWIEESYLSTLMADPAHLADDQLLASALDNLDFWRTSGPGDLSWIATRVERVHQIIEVLNLPDRFGMRTLWMRCPLHLDDFEVINPDHVVQKLR